MLSLFSKGINFQKTENLQTYSEAKSLDQCLLWECNCISKMIMYVNQLLVFPFITSLFYFFFFIFSHFPSLNN